MSTHPSAIATQPEHLPRLPIELDRKGLLRRRSAFWGCLVLSVALGSLGLSSVLMDLWQLWMSDPLRSIGMLLVPTAILLILREWHRHHWELGGIWWGLLPLILYLLSIMFSHDLVLSWRATPLGIDLLPRAFPVYLYASGVILLIAGTRVWRTVWFPMLLLLCAQPVPRALVFLFDLPLQSFAAHTARTFAAMIGFPPSNRELLKLMFAPDFGMFIAPGCDGMRGAVALGYGALIAGYLKRVSFGRWFLYVSGGVLLGHIFNLVRLCALVLYYRVALGHRTLENAASLADYVIGGVLFLIAFVLFVSIAFAQKAATERREIFSSKRDGKQSLSPRSLRLKLAVFSVFAVAAMVPGVSAIELHRQSLLGSIRNGELDPRTLDRLLPSQVGVFELRRAWQERANGVLLLESAIYESPTSGEIRLGIWLPASGHSVHYSWMTHGDSPQWRTDWSFLTAQGRTVGFDTAFYSDGVTDRFAGSVACTPLECRPPAETERALSLDFDDTSAFTERGNRPVSMFFSVERNRGAGGATAAYGELKTEAQEFLSGVSFTELSRRFQ